ncbi:hypothetical protein [Kribbella solani]|uniref:hypothetical protein n=1 Tax=Kribbella solani TaxID=236067 RepID=UPI0029BD1F2D|nr:hypothetical protein [Kribbella solani]MDX2974384.1 hypothetical protein [Kribbella solani]
MINDPQRWLDRLVGTCVSLLMGALALYGAVWLLRQVWTVLLVIAAAIGVVVAALAWWRHRQSRW